MPHGASCPSGAGPQSFVCILRDGIQKICSQAGSSTGGIFGQRNKFCGSQSPVDRGEAENSGHCSRLSATFTNANTQWHFNVPAAPHMGGPWERMVKSVKVAMKAVSDSTRHPSDEVLETIMLEAEAIVNSRPLTYVFLEAEDDESLTPNHFLLYGRTGFKQPITEPVQGNILRDSWKLAQHIIDDFWRRWVREYLPILTRRFEPVKPLKPGDLVVIIDEQARNRWERGRVLETFPDKSGQVRRATVQTTRGVLARPAVKLAVLDVNGKEDTGVVTPETEVVHGSGNVAETPRCGEKGVNNKPFHIERKGPSEQNDN
ncbi:uncharacterized protein LOC129717538 [Wyeomyia smithii]|uniref:uncharacterized protein LOC129717538 n=1 Tax=Wyeomyia smithii TaxID=174621 RepID=UPI002468201E|nr:uncharacterized protein LOC129717538 [Wyeomyia smithii]